MKLVGEIPIYPKYYRRFRLLENQLNVYEDYREVTTRYEDDGGIECVWVPAADGKIFKSRA